LSLTLELGKRGRFAKVSIQRAMAYSKAWLYPARWDCCIQLQDKGSLGDGLTVKGLNSSVLDVFHKPRKFGIFPEFCGNKT